MIDDDFPDEFENEEIQQVNDNDLSDYFGLKREWNRDMVIPRQIDDFYIEKIITETDCSVVVKATSPKYDNKNEELAIKCIPSSKFDSRIPDLLFRLNHPNILHIYDVFHYPEENPRFYGIVMPFISSDLSEYFYWTKNGHLTEITICQIMKEALEAVSYVHSEGICHCDLKIPNFLIQPKKYRPKPLLIDFDLSYSFPNNVSITARARGTQIYAAPELLNEDFSFKESVKCMFDIF